MEKNKASLIHYTIVSCKKHVLKCIFRWHAILYQPPGKLLVGTNHIYNNDEKEAAADVKSLYFVSNI